MASTSVTVVVMNSATNRREKVEEADESLMVMVSRSTLMAECDGLLYGT